MPEHPVVRTPRRRPTPLPRLDRYPLTWSAAFSVSVMAICFSYSSVGNLLPGDVRAVFLLVIRHGSLDRILGQDRAVDLHRRQREFGRDMRVLDAHRLVERLAFYPLGNERGRGD